MAPSKKSKVVTVKQIEFISPPSKGKLTINSKAGFRKGLNLMQAFDALVSADEGGLNAYQRKCLDRVAADEATKKPFEAFAMTRRFLLRQKGKKLPTGLTQVEWEELTSVPLLNSVIVSNPDPKVGVLLKKASLEEKQEFFAHVSAREKEAQRYGIMSVEEAVHQAKLAKAAAKLAAKVAKEAAEADRMEPEF